MKTKKIILFVVMLAVMSLFVSSARLPVVDSDLDNWGTILNNYLRISHDVDGSINTSTNAIFNSNVGIGTNSPNEKLVIVGKISVTDDVILSDEQFILTDTSDGSDDKSIGIAGGGSLSNIRGSFIRVSGNEDGNAGKLFLTAGNVVGGIIRMSTGGLTRLDITNAGDVGIGTSIPNAKLEVVGTSGSSVGGFPSGVLHVKDPSASVNANAVITGHNSFAGNKQLWYLGSVSGSNDNIAFINRQNANLELFTNSLARLIILADGDIGIGTSNPTAGKLHIK